MARQLSDLIVPGEPEQIASGLQFTEGPLWHPGGYLLFSDIPADTIYRWEPGREARRYIKPSRQSNGLTFDPLERLIACEHQGRQVSRIVPGGAMGTLVDNYQGKRLNSPNDVVVHSNGSIYFTDPPYGILPDLGDIGFFGFTASTLTAASRYWCRTSYAPTAWHSPLMSLCCTSMTRKTAT